MDYRQRKQIIIISILAVGLILILAGAYFKWFYNAPTCFDGKQNQKEEDVDCGGPCQVSCEQMTIKKIEVEWAKAILLKEKSYDLVAKISNPNPNYGLSQFKYTFKIYDGAEQLILEQKGNDFILPAQSKYIIAGNVNIDNKAEKAELVIDEPQKTDWQKLKPDYENPDIYVRDKQFKFLESGGGSSVSQTGTAQASGIIKNNSAFDFDRIGVFVVLFDEDKNIIGVNKTEARTIMAGEERYFSTLWFSPLSGEVKSAEMQAETNLFLDENFMRRYGASEKFQEYPVSD